MANTVPAVVPDKPARAEDVLNRPDPNEKRLSTASALVSQQQHQQQLLAAANIKVYAGNSNTTINLDPEAQAASAHPQHPPPQYSARNSIQSDPFQDSHSIQTTSTGTRSNVIPIALVAPGSVSSQSARSNPISPQTTGSGPVRPLRDPQLNLNLDHVNVSKDNIRSDSPYSHGSSGSVLSGNVRHSYMTTGSYASDLLSEAPVIITPMRGTVKQVLGVVKAEVIRTPGSSALGSDGTPTSGDSLRAGFSRPPMRSPLAASSFGPSDVLRESADEHDKGQDLLVRANPFSDEHSPYLTNPSAQTSPAPSTSTFGSKGTTPPQTQEDWTPEEPRLPWAGGNKDRPASSSTQSGSIIAADISSATRVHVGLHQFATSTHLAPPSSTGLDTPVSAALSSPRSPPNANRMTSAKLISPASNTLSPGANGDGQLESQQRRAFEEMDGMRDRSSVVSSTSTRADSILESFPFVPPSPISDRPIRTPPRSPLAQQAFSNSNPNPLASSTMVPTTNNDSGPETEKRDESGRETGAVPRPARQANLPPPPSMNRKFLGLSTASDSSTMSSGLGSFPFQIDSGNNSSGESGNGGDGTANAPSNVSGKQRASLDTLALTSDLSSYPLSFDRNLMEHYPGPYKPQQQ